MYLGFLCNSKMWSITNINSPAFPHNINVSVKNKAHFLKRLEPSYIAGTDPKMQQQLLEIVRQLLKKLKTESPYDPEVPLSCLHTCVKLHNDYLLNLKTLPSFCKFSTPKIVCAKNWQMPVFVYSFISKALQIIKFG